MKAVVFYERSDASMDEFMKVYPEHQAFSDKFVARGDTMGLGAFADGNDSMGIFTTREAAEHFVKGDPFVVQGLVAKVTIRDWHDED